MKVQYDNNYYGKLNFQHLRNTTLANYAIEIHMTMFCNPY